MTPRSHSGFCSDPLCKGKPEQLVTGKKYPLCPKHYFQSVNAKKLEKAKKVLVRKVRKPLKKTAIKKKFRKATGEGLLFARLAASRPPVCEVCGKYIKELIAHNFAHILPKSTHPTLRLNEENIAILCFDYGQGCHEKWDTKSLIELRSDERWQPIFQRQMKLKISLNLHKY